MTKQRTTRRKKRRKKKSNPHNLATVSPWGRLDRSSKSNNIFFFAALRNQQVLVFKPSDEKKNFFFFVRTRIFIFDESIPEKVCKFFIFFAHPPRLFSLAFCLVWRCEFEHELLPPPLQAETIQTQTGYLYSTSWNKNAFGTFKNNKKPPQKKKHWKKVRQKFASKNLLSHER